MNDSDIKKLGNEIIKHCNQGYSIASFLAKASMSYKEWSKLCHIHPVLQEAIEIAQAEELMYWEEKLIASLTKDDSKTANIARGMLSERGDLYEKIYGKNKFISTPDDMRKRVVTLGTGDRKRDILDEALGNPEAKSE